MSEMHVGPLLAIRRELDSESRRQVEAHLAGCEACRALAAVYADQDYRLSRLRQVQPSARWQDAVYARTRAARPASRLRLSQPAGVLLAVIVMLVALSAGTYAVSAEALPGDFLYPLKRGMEEATLAVLSVPQQQAGYEQMLFERRRNEARRVLELRRRAALQFDGALERLDDGSWAVGGIRVRLDPPALESAGLKPGDRVRISGDAADGELLVRDIQPSPVSSHDSPLPPHGARPSATPTGTPTATHTAGPKPADPTDTPTHRPAPSETPTAIASETPTPDATPSEAPTALPRRPRLTPTWPAVGPMPTGTPSPGIIGTLRPRPTDTFEPKPTGTLEPTPTGTFEPRLPGTFEPRPTGRPGPRSTGTPEPMLTPPPAVTSGPPTSVTWPTRPLTRFPQTPAATNTPPMQGGRGTATPAPTANAPSPAEPWW